MSMLRFDRQKSKLLQFSLKVSGITEEQLEARFRINAGAIEYGFLGKVENGKAIVTIPPLMQVMGMAETKSNTFKAKFELTGDENHKEVWEGEIRVEEVITMQATLENEVLEDLSDVVSIEAGLLQEEDIVPIETDIDTDESVKELPLEEKEPKEEKKLKKHYKDMNHKPVSGKAKDFLNFTKQLD